MSAAVTEHSQVPASPAVPPGRPNGLGGKQIVARVVVIVALAFIVAMWIYAYTFAPDKPLAQLDDRSWAKRADNICDVRNDLLDANAEQTIEVSDGTPRMVGQAVQRATEIIEDALDEVVAVVPISDRDVGLIATWEGLYRTYIADRRIIEDRLLAGEDVELNETTLNGSPISLSIDDFAKHNFMERCSVPTGR